MKKNMNNIMLSLSLIFIFSISIYFIVQWIRSENINHYLDLLGNKLLAMVPENKKKDEVAQMYDKFKQQVEEKKVAPEKVEKVAVEILNLKNREDSLSLHQVEKAMQMALNIPKGVDPEVLKHGGLESGDAVTPLPPNERKWRDLRDRLKNAYIFEENLKKHQRERDIHDRLFFQYDSNLQIIIDSRLRQELLHGVDQALIESIKELEKQKVLVWRDNYEQLLEKKMQALNDSLKKIELNLTKIPIPIPVKVGILGIDSLNIKIKLSPDSAVSPNPPLP
jgi:hypothetical protein